VIDKVINYLLKNDLLNEEAIIICEFENSSIKKEYNELSLFKEKKYGLKEVTIFKKII
jgi:16S rRNA G966 N2-methylase RsmD